MSTLHNSLVGLETMQSRDDLEVRIQRQALAALDASSVFTPPDGTR